MKQNPHSGNLRLHRLSDTPATFFVTKSLYPKNAVLDEAAREIIVSAFAFAVRQERIFLRAFVVMIDHRHALFALRENWTLPKIHASHNEFCRRKDSCPSQTSRHLLTKRVLRHPN
jgi:hypothetical protein